MDKAKMRKCANAQVVDEDEARERKIARLLGRLASAPAEKRPAIWAEARDEIRARSPAQIQRMEAARGLDG